MEALAARAHHAPDKVLRVNLSGAFYMSKPALEHMKCHRQRRRGQRGFRSRPLSSDRFLGSVDGSGVSR
jgi:NAD(P)-dependent dehydrogenase (short-subunit alcohol dehydrogenase family)